MRLNANAEVRCNMHKVLPSGNVGYIIQSSNPQFYEYSIRRFNLDETVHHKDWNN